VAEELTRFFFAQRRSTPAPLDDGGADATTVFSDGDVGLSTLGSPALRQGHDAGLRHRPSAAASDSRRSQNYSKSPLWCGGRRLASQGYVPPDAGRIDYASKLRRDAQRGEARLADPRPGQRAAHALLGKGFLAFLFRSGEDLSPLGRPGYAGGPD